MMRSLFSGVAGLRTHQTRMDVIGNNIANVNTVAFKSSSMNFQDMLYQTTQAATGSNAQTGRAGQNPRQIGLGSTTASINTSITTAGSAESTGNPFDIYITGDSFFVLSPDGGGTKYYSRSGAFNVDEVGTLCNTANGYAVLGWRVSESDPTLIDTSQLQTLPIMSADNKTSDPAATEKAYMSGIIDSSDTALQEEKGKVFSLTFYDNLGYKYTANFSIKPAATAGTSGDAFTLSLASITGESDEPEGEVSGTVDIQFDKTTGKVADPNNAKFTLKATKLKGTDVEITVDYSKILNIANNKQSTVAIDRGTSSTDTTGAGYAVGSMIGVSIGTDGTLTGTYDNGQTKLLGKIPTATFSNASGLSKEGENLYSETLNSGTAKVNDVTASGSGKLTTGQLEMSNVDLAKEFTTMITTQRGFQANSRIITVSDTLIEEISNMKR